jgi:hypothetical protein
MVIIGDAERIVWWNDTDTALSEMFDKAMFSVKRPESAVTMRHSRGFDLGSVRALRGRLMQHPIVVANACAAVRSQGNLA